MHVVMVSSEVFPYSKTGGLADVCGALPRALARMGCRVSLVTPMYSTVRAAGFPLRKGPRPGVLVGRLPSSRVPVYFIEHHDYYDRDGLYDDSYGRFGDNLARFSYLAWTALQMFSEQGAQPDILHAHDWQTALVLPLARTRFAGIFADTRLVLTIHNLAYQGQFEPAQWPSTGLDPGLFNWQQMEFYGKINVLKGAIVFADAITTVSPTYALEIQTPEAGEGLDPVLRRRAPRLTGILNGVDYDQWDPRNDSHIAASFGPRSLRGKHRCKSDLQKKMNLPQERTIPVVGLVSRLVPQKGIDLFLAAADQLLRERAQFVILGTGNPHWEELLRTFSRRFPDRFHATIGFDDRLAHQIEAGADLFLMPSRYEPCGLNQIYSLRYGTLPIVRQTGGLADTVRDGATGFVFPEFKVDSLVSCFRRALSTFQDPTAWKNMIREAMTQDYSWDRSARQYLSLYRSLTKR